VEIRLAGRCSHACSKNQNIDCWIRIGIWIWAGSTGSNSYVGSGNRVLAKRTDRDSQSSRVVISSAVERLNGILRMLGRQKSGFGRPCASEMDLSNPAWDNLTANFARELRDCCTIALSVVSTPAYLYCNPSRTRTTARRGPPSLDHYVSTSINLDQPGLAASMASFSINMGTRSARGENREGFSLRQLLTILLRGTLLTPL